MRREEKSFQSRNPILLCLYFSILLKFAAEKNKQVFFARSPFLAALKKPLRWKISKLIEMSKMIFLQL